MSKHSVLFFPDNVAVQVETGTSLLRAASLAGIELKSTCGGKGTCGRCVLKVKEGKVSVGGGNISAKLKTAGYVLACQTRVEGHAVVEVPRDSRLDEHQVLLDNKPVGLLAEKQVEELAGYEFQPLCRKIYLELDKPTLTENASDLSRLQAELRKYTDCRDLEISLDNLRKLPDILREGDWKVTVTLTSLNGCAEVLHLEPGRSTKKSYGLAVDIGTTTVVVNLVDLETGQIVDKRGTYNRQSRYGDDVISRIIYAGEENGLEELQQAVIGTINHLVDKLLAKNEIKAEDVHVAVTAGNTTMAHLFLGIPPKYIRLEPYIPVTSSFPPVKAKELGIAINPEAWILSFPAVASYVGGDIVSGVLVNGMAESDELTLFIDIGTNGEMVLGNRDWLISCACSAGPAFEGGGITYGMRAMTGAIERVEIDPRSYEVQVATIGNVKPMGICGSGLIDCLAKLLRVGIIDRTGQFQKDINTPRLRETEDGKEFVLVWGKDTECGKDIVLTEGDIKNLIRSKGAVFAGIQSLLKTVQMDVAQIDKIIIAGGFGNYLNIEDAIQIGLLPDVDRSKYEFMGNTSIKGAKLALISQPAYRQAEELGRKMTYLELSVGTMFMDEFVSACFLPHTDLSLFPSATKQS
ncbi:ASKHA domain-containing protein [Calderihabitans maritimus]|uniref:Ferredoxin n=1 Tax=Calderihabitans maritimus TaxID=1246530 RepID=A0A1Z5HR39_9FIRM|nr:ASKHA domain-containing protein [Calderihabitans maritimus]GAW91837.1 ferredoxin [Calderihabitans maritimus]